MADQNYNPDYAYLDQLSTEQLEELLRADVESLESSHDELIFYILEVIEKREKEFPTGRLPDVDKAWAEFNEYYNTPEGDGLSLYPNGNEDESPINVCETKRFNIQRKPRFLTRRLTIAVILICIVLMSTIPAFGYSSIFQMIGQWTAEQFGFIGMPSNSNDNVTPANQVDENYTSLQAVLNQYGITDTVVPQRIPDEFQLEELWIQEYPEKDDAEFIAPYSKGDDYIIISIIRHSGQVDKLYEKNEENVVQYISGNVEHYIFQNNNDITAAWSVNSLECSINTTLSISELKKIIDSIYEE